MKKLKVIALSMLAFVTIASMAFVACRKQQEIVSTTLNTALLKKVELIGSDFIAKNPHTKTRNKKGYMLAADAAGAAAASGSAGLPFIGPYIVLYSAFGASMAAGQWYYDNIEKPKGKLIAPSSNFDNSHNFVEQEFHLGQLHNELLVKYINEYPNNGIFDNNCNLIAPIIKIYKRLQ